jgi:hypothetical protein
LGVSSSLSPLHALAEAVHKSKKNTKLVLREPCNPSSATNVWPPRPKPGFRLTSHRAIHALISDIFAPQETLQYGNYTWQKIAKNASKSHIFAAHRPQK